MIAKIYKELVIILLLFLVGWGVFTYLKIKPTPPELEVSIEQEEKLGEILIENFLSTANVIESDTIDSAIFVIKQRLLSGLELTEYNYKFYVIANEEVNAFATLGGNIVIFSGLIELSDSPEEVAAVIAHEIGHVEHRHVVSKIVKEIGVTLIFSILSGNDPVLVSEIVKQSISTIFDRSQESEADDFGLELMEQTNISPRNLARIFRKIKAEYGGYNDNLEFLMTHPNTNKRIQKSLEYDLREDFVNKPIELNWDAVKRNI